MEHLAAPLAAAARGVAARLKDAGQRAWIVGGAVRDLALGGEATDVDLTTAARPEQVEACFARTASVGRAFGTVLVLDFEVDVEVTTFRAESGYSDGRHPDRVSYSDTVEEDAQRRDFTCNALYLDPLTGEVADPAGGLRDLAERRLRCVGEPRERFREDGLRILRMARFAARLGLEVEQATRAAAAGALDALRGVSAERIYAELWAIAGGPNPARALGLLAEAGALERCLAGWDPTGAEARIGAVERLAPEAGALVVLAALCGGEAAPLEALKAPRAVLDGVARLAELRRGVAELPAEGRAPRLRLVRGAAWAGALMLERAARGPWLARMEELERLRESLSEAELHPAPLLASADLAAASVPRGPRWGSLLREAETRQLEGELRTRDEALAWLAARAAQDGGNTRRSP